MAQPGTDQHKGRVAVWEAAHHTGTAADLPVQPLNHIVGSDAGPVFSEKNAVGQRPINAILQLLGGGTLVFVIAMDNPRVAGAILPNHESLALAEKGLCCQQILFHNGPVTVFPNITAIVEEVGHKVNPHEAVGLEA